MNKLRNLYYASDPYERYFARNLHEFGYKDEEKMTKTVLFGLDATTAMTIWSDPLYGFEQPDTLYSWVLAMNRHNPDVPAGDATYKRILAHFTEKKLKGFDESTMEQICGINSVMFQLSHAFAYNVADQLDYGATVDRAKLMTDQWGSRLMTKNTKLPLVWITVDDKTGKVTDYHKGHNAVLVNSTYDMTSGDASKALPGSLTALPFPPEINYFLEVTLKVAEADAAIDANQAKGLLSEDDPLDPQTLINPDSMEFVWRKRQTNDVDALRKRFTSVVATRNLTDQFIDGLGKYLDQAAGLLDDDASDQDLRGGKRYSSSSSFGSLMATTLRK